MAYDHAVADQIRAALSDRTDVAEREMFGGIAFLVDGNMAVGVSGDGLMVRVGPEAHDEALALPGAEPFTMAPRPMRGWLTVTPVGFATDVDLRAWVARGVAFAASLPPK
ncbi:MAG TPA: TfoX/Sxy family protein [Candidatus Limnocylindria bacterium]